MYPLWKIDTKILIQDFINLDFKTLICSANANFFASDQLGRTLDAEFIKALPWQVDPCGENGEFHTFVYHGPIFHYPIKVFRGEVIKTNYSFRMKDENEKEVVQQTPFWFMELTSS